MLQYYMDYVRAPKNIQSQNIGQKSGKNKLDLFENFQNALKICAHPCALEDKANDEEEKTLFFHESDEDNEVINCELKCT